MSAHPDRDRRRFLEGAAALAALAAFRGIAPAYAQSGATAQQVLRVGGDRVGEIVVDRTAIDINGRIGTAVTMNGTVPGPLLRFREGDTVTLRVTNRLPTDTSIHWHGLLVPNDMDGVPGLSFAGIRPGEAFTYRYRVRQNGTFWYHSHSGFQEQQGHYAPMIIEPAGADPVRFDRDLVVVLADWTFEDPMRVFEKLKKQGDYYNFQRITVGDFARDVRRMGFKEALAAYRDWWSMRMSPADILDVTGATYTYLMNGLPAAGNWTGIFKAGERVRLRFINSAAQTFFNVRIPGLPMTIVQADGQNVRPVTVDEFQFGAAETYDVIVEPRADAYTIFAEAMDRSGYVRGTLATRPGLSADVPALRKRPLRNMVDMGMDMESMGMSGMDHSKMQGMQGMDHSKMQGMQSMDHSKMQGMQGMDHSKMQDMQGMDHSKMQGMQGMDRSTIDSMVGMDSPVNGRHGPDMHGPGNSSVAQVQRDRLGEPGAGLEGVPHRVLNYKQLRALEANADPRPPERQIEMHLTGNMEAFIWGMDGKRFSEAEPVRVRVGERVRLTMVNDTMMEHPMHLHGVFMELVNGSEPAHQPRKHTVIVKPAERLSVDFTFDEPGNFAFHCHMLLHMEAGMFRTFNVSPKA